jgi:thioester reductase-like protein
MRKTLFVTGFPGFLGSELLPRLLERAPDARAACLVQGKFADLARRRAAEIMAANPALAKRIDILEGDIAQPALGFPGGSELHKSVFEIYHLAAVYDLGVGRELAMRVNVEGTRRVLDFAGECPSLRRFHYVSTCYVSGRHAGDFTEDDLDRGQAFHNFYEETKFLAEVEVQNRMRAGLPATTYRPSIVVGDSRTGSTQKYDGPYSVIRLLLRQPRLALMPIIGDPRKVEVNLVPRDFVLDALTYLSGRDDSRCRVFHLADPHPLTVAELVAELARATRRSAIRVPLPLGLAKMSLRRIPGMQRLIGVSPATLDYFVHPARYRSERTQAALDGSAIRCPRFSEYADRLVEFVVAHPEIGAAAMA